MPVFDSLFDELAASVVSLLPLVGDAEIFIEPLRFAKGERDVAALLKGHAHARHATEEIEQFTLKLGGQRVELQDLGIHAPMERAETLAGCVSGLRFVNADSVERELRVIGSGFGGWFFLCAASGWVRCHAGFWKMRGRL